MPNFRFISTDIFPIFRRGVVFRGVAEVGTVSVGDGVSLLTRSGRLAATVAAIELDRKLIARSVVGVEIGLLLAEFDRESVNARVRALIDESNAHEFASIESVLGVEMPVVLELKANS